VSRIAVLKGGRSLERQVSLHSGARVQDALERLGHDVVPIDVGHDLVARLRDEAPDACFIALHGRDGEDGTVQELLELLAIPYTGSRPGACARCADKVLAKQAMRRAGIPTPDFLSFGEAAFKVLGATEALPLAGDRLGFPLVVKPADQGSALGLRLAAGARSCPPRSWPAFSYSGKVLLERRISGRDLAVSVLDGEALPGRGGDPRGPGPLRRPLRGRRARGSPARPPSRRGDGAGPAAGGGGPRAAGLHGRLARRPHARGRHGRAAGARSQRDPRHDGHEPAPAGRRRGGHRVRGARGADAGARRWPCAAGR
jgi:hypothetical protein